MVFRASNSAVREAIPFAAHPATQRRFELSRRPIFADNLGARSECDVAGKQKRGTKSPFVLLRPSGFAKAPALKQPNCLWRIVELPNVVSPTQKYELGCVRAGGRAKAQGIFRASHAVPDGNRTAINSSVRELYLDQVETWDRLANSREGCGRR